jgi:hypothetical protein
MAPRGFDLMAATIKAIMVRPDTVKGLSKRLGFKDPRHATMPLARVLNLLHDQGLLYKAGLLAGRTAHSVIWAWQPHPFFHEDSSQVHQLEETSCTKISLQNFSRAQSSPADSSSS